MHPNKKIDKMDIYEFICKHFEETLFFPTYRYISEKTYISLSVLARKLYQLERMGLIVQYKEGSGWRLTPEKIIELTNVYIDNMKMEEGSK